MNKLAGDIGERNLFTYAKLVAAADYIRIALAGYGYEVQRQVYEVSGQPCENLSVEIPGRDRPDEIVVIGGHYDSVRGSPGANDNATGVAAVLALARAFVGQPSSRTLRFLAFVNEEPPFFQTGQMGSWVYAKRSRQRGEQIVAMLSLETIGYYSDVPGSQRYPFPLNFFYPPTGNFIGFVGNVQNRGLVRQVVKGFRGQSRFPSEGAALLGLFPGVGWSDHWAFWKEGFPAIMITDTALFRYPSYHLPSDTPEQVRYDHMARVVSGVEQVVRDLANPPGHHRLPASEVHLAVGEARPGVDVRGARLEIVPADLTRRGDHSGHRQQRAHQQHPRHTASDYTHRIGSPAKHPGIETGPPIEGRYSPVQSLAVSQSTPTRSSPARGGTPRVPPPPRPGPCSSWSGCTRRSCRCWEVR